MTQKIYPGMTDNSTEFFLFEKEMKVIQNGEIKSFFDISSFTMGLLKEAINKDKAVKLALFDLHPTSDMKRLEQFATCRFGGLDFQADIKNNQLQDGEYWECPKRGSCPHEGTLCKLPIVNGTRLSSIDVKLMQLSTTELTNEAIADKMNMPMGTFHKFKKALHDLLHVQTKQGITLISKAHNLI